MHIYAFGSVCRGEIDIGSDIDLLAIVDGYDSRFDPSIYSIYTLARLKEIWKEGNPFAWHLALESKLIYSDDGKDILKNLGMPKVYANANFDCIKFYNIFLKASNSLYSSVNSKIFDLSTIFLSIRNIATCYSLQAFDQPDFSRNSARRLGDISIPISEEVYRLYERSRILCTRGYGEKLTDQEISIAVNSMETIKRWMLSLIENLEGNNNE